MNVMVKRAYLSTLFLCCMLVLVGGLKVGMKTATLLGQTDVLFLQHMHLGTQH